MVNSDIEELARRLGVKVSELKFKQQPKPEIVRKRQSCGVCGNTIEQEVNE